MIAPSGHNIRSGDRSVVPGDARYVAASDRLALTDPLDHPTWAHSHAGYPDITKDSQSMTDFRNHSAEIVQHLKDTRRPVILTVNGKAAAVVQDADAYQHLLARGGG